MARKVFLCTVVSAVALAVACGKSNPAPTSPSSATVSDTGAAPDGSTLKATPPSPVSPINGAQPDTLALTANAARLNFASATLQYHFQIRSGGTVVYDSQAAGLTILASGNNVSVTPSVALTPDTNYTWRVRATMQGANGPWSSDASFKSPVGGYIRGAEIFDPLIGGRTVGALFGGAVLNADGVFLPDHPAHVSYQLQQPLTAGQVSVMIKGLSRSTAGEKSKVFSMQEGFDDITTNRRRATADFRGRAYPTPGAITCRFITNLNDGIYDCPRIVAGAGFDATRWYFWVMSWQRGSTNLTVRQDSETGPIMYSQTMSTGSREYLADPHVIHLGQPLGRGGENDATASGITLKSLWVSANPRPAFPQ